MKNSYQKDPFQRAQIVSLHNFGFWGFMKGKMSAGENISIQKAAQEYADMFQQLDLEPSALDKGYQRLNQLCREMNKTN